MDMRWETVDLIVDEWQFYLCILENNITHHNTSPYILLHRKIVKKD
jgi:hypothetical protein